jgi:serine/threonine-protein kinase
VVPLPEGPGLVYEANDGLRLAPLQGEPRTRRLGGERAIPYHRMSLSPDGRWLAYSSSTSGRSEVYIRTFPGEGKIFQITHGGGSTPLWSRRGGEIFYSKEPGGVRRMCSARVSATSNQIMAAAPVDLFDIAVDTTVIGLHPDGERVLALRRVAATFKGDRVDAILHWSDQVAARAPARSSLGL